MTAVTALELGALGPGAPLSAADARALVRASVCLGSWESARGGDLDLPDGLAHVELVVRGDLAPARPDGGDGGAARDSLRAPLGGERRFVCAIGAFDGLHRGHRALLERARAEADARGCALMAVTFSPDPARVLEQGAAEGGCDLLPVGERRQGLMLPFVDALLVVSFTPALARLSHRRFVRDVLGALVDVRALVVGSDFRLGAGGAGTVAALAEVGRAEGFDVVGVPLADEGGLPITATRVRALLRAGSVEDAAGLLGRCHHVFGEVEHGRGEGTSFGFPTANVRVWDGLCLPAEGVYAGYVLVDDVRGTTAWPAAVNVGKPRTFAPGQEGASFLEATLLGFSGDLYGRGVTVVFVRWLRAPERFGSLAELERAVLANVDWVRRTLGEAGVAISGTPRAAAAAGEEGA